MKKLKFALLLSLFANWSFAQLVNDGATITIKNGATLFVETDVQNNTTGTITVETGGTLEVQGSFTNAATALIDVQGTGKLKFTGASNSNLTTNTDAIRNLEVSKSNSTVTLVDNLTITNNLDFGSAGSSKLVLGANTAILNSGATITGNDADEYVNASAAGFLQKNYADGALAASAFTFPVGDATNYSPLATAVTGTAATANLKVNVVNAVHPSKPADAESHLTRYWNVDQTNITGYSNAVTGTYINSAEDIVGNQALIKGASYDGSAWSYTGAATNGTTTVSGSLNDMMADFTGTNFYGKVNLKAFLSGNYNTGTNLMNTTLNSLSGVNVLGKFAINSPYTDAPANVVDSAFFPQHPTIVDWIKLEAYPSTQTNGTGSFTTANAIAKVSALLLSNGSIVSPTDASSPVVIKNADTNSKIKIAHRNHLPVRTDAAIPTDADSPAPVDFTTGTPVFYNNGSGNNPMNLFNSTFNAMWQSNVNSIKTSDAGPLSANIDFQINAVDLGLEKTNTTSTASNVYSIFDLNLDRNKNAADFGIAKSATTTTKTADL